ncbi:hypothetical protein SAZ_01440 [Streptomyces noursei ZPM]|nr:hypothetical protein SAZ_01440 [Streptomyces noursei ZPM]
MASHRPLPDMTTNRAALLLETPAGARSELLLTSHDLAVARSIADRVGALRQGRPVETGPVADVFTQTVVIPAAGHLAPLEQPSAYCTLLLDFVRHLPEQER